MLHEPSLIAAALRRLPRTPESDASTFWKASLRFHRLIRDGKLILAAVMLDDIREGGEALLSGPLSGHALGRRMVQMAADPFRGRGFLSHMRGAR